jgi:hypothetical protein
VTCYTTFTERPSPGLVSIVECSLVLRNTPAFGELVGPFDLDLGCGHGHDHDD